MSKPKKSEGPKEVWELDDVLTFGKHKGETVRDAMQDDPNWFYWALEEIEWFKLSNEAYEFLPEERDPEHDDDLDRDIWGDREY